MFIISIFLILPFISNNKVSASQRNNYEINIGNIQNVDDVGYLYNFDGSPDYIYVDFINQTGYVIFSEETLEILEYANNGYFPYDSISELGKKTEISIGCVCDRKKFSSCWIEKNCRGE